MAGNAYKRTVLELEVVLQEKLAQLKILEEENTRLRRHEAALSTAVGSVEGSVTMKAKVLRSSSFGPADSGSSRGWSPGVGDTCVSSSPHAMLEKVEEKEREIRREMRQLGAGNYSQLYSTQLLHKAASSPGLVAACLACDPDTRRRDWIEAVRQLALLLPKYDFSFPCSTPGDVTNTVSNSVSNKGSTAKQKVDGLVDEVTTRVLVCGLLDPPPVVLYDLMVNLERGEVEMYPANYWKNVAAGLHLTSDQKHKLQFSWQKVKDTKAAHQALSARLTQLQQHFHARFAQFEAQAQQAMQDNKLEDVQQVQAQLAVAAMFGKQQQEQSPQMDNMSPPAQRQQQQQQVVKIEQPGMDQVMQQQQQQQHSQQQQQQQMHELSGSALAAMVSASLAGDMSEAPPAAAAAAPSAADTAAGVVAMQPQQQQQQPSTSAAAAAAAAASQGCLNDHPLFGSDLQLQLPADSLCNSPPLMDLLTEWSREDATALFPPSPLHYQQHHHQQQQEDTATSAEPVTPAASEGSALSSGPMQQQQQYVGLPPLPQAASPAVQLPTPEWQQQWWQQQLQQQQAWQQQQQQQALQQQDPPGPSNPKEEVLLQVGSPEQRQLEVQLDSTRQLIKLQHFCQVLQLVNTLSRKQLASLYVLAFPYMPDAFMLCEELEAEAAAEEAATRQ